MGPLWMGMLLRPGGTSKLTLPDGMLLPMALVKFPISFGLVLPFSSLSGPFPWVSPDFPPSFARVSWTVRGPSRP